MLQVSTRTNAPAPVFAALGCVTRLELVSRLGDGKEHSITALTDGLDLTQVVTKHLLVLQQAGMVDSRRVGRESRFTIRPDPITEARDYLTGVSDQWDEAIARLRSAVEKKGHT
jgi:DNA-binding transcriptional ArsR family regulator